MVTSVVGLQKGERDSKEKDHVGTLTTWPLVNTIMTVITFMTKISL